MNRVEECRQLVQQLINQYPKNDLYPIISYAILQKEKKFREAQETLSAFIKKIQIAQSIRV